MVSTHHFFKTVRAAARAALLAAHAYCPPSMVDIILSGSSIHDDGLRKAAEWSSTTQGLTSISGRIGMSEVSMVEELAPLALAAA